VTVGREFDMTVVATGIETPADAQRAREFGVAWGEGGLFGRPKPLTAQLAVPRSEPLL
jgi:EAL domain-containing protein (putative c-di-GMP-specific phosphodiesterase class I)